VNDEMESKLSANLDRLLAAYRGATPDFDPGPGFMPGLWEQIEARRSKRWFFRLTRVVVAAGALAAMVLVVAPDPAEPGVASVSYVEALAQGSSFDRDILRDAVYLEPADEPMIEERSSPQ
jgi:hypothetical protein